MKKVKKLSGQKLKLLLGTPLAKLRIRKLQIWAQKPGHPEDCHSRPKTVEDFIKVFPYEVPVGCKIRGSEFRSLLDGLGSGTINKMRRKLLRLGVTPDIWPALLHRKDFLGNLSKETILEIPVRVILSHCSDWELAKYLKCKDMKELGWKTMADFFKKDPRKSNLFFARHKHKLTRVRLLLEERGFTKADGAFFRWNPNAASLKRAKAKLVGRGLNHFYINLLAKIAVQVGWV